MTAGPLAGARSGVYSISAVAMYGGCRFPRTMLMLDAVGADVPARVKVCVEAKLLHRTSSKRFCTNVTAVGSHYHAHLIHTPEGTLRV